MFLHRCSTPIALAIASILFTPFAATANPLEEMHGKTYQTFSSGSFGVVQVGILQGLEDQGGWMVSSTDVEQPFIISIYRHAETNVLSFEQILEQQRYGHHGTTINEQTREILDSATFTEAGDWLPECQINGVGDKEVVAIAPPYEESHFNTEWFTEFQGLWRANRETQQLEPMSSENVRCYNMGYLYDG